jgi:hypothetical protein
MKFCGHEVLQNAIKTPYETSNAFCSTHTTGAKKCLVAPHFLELFGKTGACDSYPGGSRLGSVGDRWLAVSLAIARSRINGLPGGGLGWWDATHEGAGFNCQADEEVERRDAPMHDATFA